MTIADRKTSLVQRYFTKDCSSPYSLLKWELRDSVITNHLDGSVAFEQKGVEFPSTWSMNASNIVTQKYFRGTIGEADREKSLKDLVGRVVEAITEWGIKDGYFSDDEEAYTFNDELAYLLLNQMAAFNSPVWFNIGVEGVPQQASACFILSVEDTMESILNWYKEEGMIFKGGSGAGVNLSNIRSSKEFLKGGGAASGPVSFMRGADASAGTIKSGGKTRRAAKMVMLDVDHPDVEEFIWIKAREEKKIKALTAAGFDMGLDGVDMTSVQYQNANNSVRLTDEFMRAVTDDGDWHLRSRTTGEIVDTLKALDVRRAIAQAAWECADPGVQFDTTINDWHTLADTSRINGSNPCSEYMSIDNSACNLASLNLMKFYDGKMFDAEAFAAAVRVIFTAQDILVGNADYPTELIGENSRKYRQLGIGYANLGALLMAMGHPYDSDEGRKVAAVITSLMTGTAYLQSALMAADVGPFSGFEDNKGSMLKVLRKHLSHNNNLEIGANDYMADAWRMATQAWELTEVLTEANGIRNSQASVLAPTGTIGLMMDCDTTGVEPDLSLFKTKRLVGGGTMSIINQTIPLALENLGYSERALEEIMAYLEDEKTIVGAPNLLDKHLPVFATSMGDNVIHYMGHVKMMAAIQPFISGAISKTVNLPEDATVEDVERLIMEAWFLNLKALAIYRDNCKVGQPLSTTKKASEEQPKTVTAPAPPREKLERMRNSKTFEFRVSDLKGFATVGEYEDGRPGEVFIKVSKQGSTLAGIMDALAISISHGLQYGVPLKSFVEAFVGMRFDPAGMTDDPDVRISSSIIDYLFRRLALEYLTKDERESLGIYSINERTELLEETVVESVPVAVATASSYSPDAPMCAMCGVLMQRSGSCHACTSCGSTSGCS